MNFHCLVAVLVTLVVIDVGDGLRFSRYRRRQWTIRGCLKSRTVKNIVTRFVCPKPDPCAGIDCNCNGKCTEGKCNCDPGFTGEFCSVLVPECINGVVETQTNGSLACICNQFFTGADCSVSECINGVLETQDDGSSICNCNPFFSGADCSFSECFGYVETRPDGLYCVCTRDSPTAPCDGPDCNNGVLVTRTNGSSVCNCNQGFTGAYCDVLVPECFNGVLETQTDGSLACICNEFFTGPDCRVFGAR